MVATDTQAPEVIDLQERSEKEQGTTASRRLRRSGLVPAVVYGDGPSIPVAIPAEVIGGLIRHHQLHGVMKLKIGGKSRNAIIRDIQIHPMTDNVLHVDFQAVKMSDVVTVQVPITLHGTAPGADAGGILEHALREIEVECRVDALPEEISVSINELNIGDHISVADLELPDGVRVLAEPEELVVQVIEPIEVSDEELEPGEVAGEPELVGGEKTPDEEADND